MADTIDPCQMYRNLNQHRRSSLSFSESNEHQDQTDCGLTRLKSDLIRCNSLDSDKAMVKSILKSSCLRKKACLKAAEQTRKAETEKKSVCFAGQASVTDTYSPDHYDQDGRLKECCVETVDIKESYLQSKPSKICNRIEGGGQYCKNGEVYVRGSTDSDDDENETGAEKKKKHFKKILWERLVKVCSPEEYKKMKAKCKSAKKTSVSSAIGIPDKCCPTYYNQCPSLFGSF